MAFQVKQTEPDVIPADTKVYYRGLDKELHQINVDEADAVEARRLVQVELHNSNTKTIGPVLALIQGGKV